MTSVSSPSRTDSNLQALSRELTALLDHDPAEAVRRARQIEVSESNHANAIALRAAILVDGGVATRQQEAIEEGVALYRQLHETHPVPDIRYNLANALVAAFGPPPHDDKWLDHRETTRALRTEARKLYWRAAQSDKASVEIRTQAWTNLANQFAQSDRLGEAHDARLAALAIDPTNGVAAGCAALDLLRLFLTGGCSDLTRIEAIMLAKVAKQHVARVRAYAGEQAAIELASLADELGEPPQRAPHKDRFVRWVEQERLTLAPVVELVDPSLGKLDWLTLPGILERTPGSTATTPPPLFAMFNVLRADFILARDLAWRATNDDAWPTTGRFADTLDYATYGPDASALVLAHRTALDLLDKVAVTANHYFEMGLPQKRIYFDRAWRKDAQRNDRQRRLLPAVEKAIRGGARALYGLVELAEDYGAEDGILHPQKDLRNAGTHRFVVLHDIGDVANCRQAAEVEHHQRDEFSLEVMRALRVARSAVQMLALAITQHESALAKATNGRVGTMPVYDHDWVRGHDKDSQ